MRSDSQENSKRRVGFRYAWNGIKEVVKSEINVKIHLLAAAIVLLLGFFSQLSVIEWVLILLTIGSVISFEMINTAIERIMNFLAPEFNPVVGKIKDISAGAVLVSAIISILVGLLIFLPKVISWLT